MDINELLQQKKNKIYGIKTVAVKAIDVSTSSRIVTGFFNTFNFLDSDDDVLMPGSAKKSISERGPESTAIAKIKHALFHDLQKLPGKIQVLAEKKINNIKGIYFETKMSNTQLGNDTLMNYLEEVYDNHSIGFKYDKLDYIESNTDDFKAIVDTLINPEAVVGKGGLWKVSEINLFEGSTVSFGANSLTPFLGTKSLNKDSYALALMSKLDKLDSALKNGKQSDDMMNVFELEILQIKQMLNEMFENVTIKGDNIKQEILDKKEEQEEKINWNNILKRI